MTNLDLLKEITRKWCHDFDVARLKERRQAEKDHAANYRWPVAIRLKVVGDLDSETS